MTGGRLEGKAAVVVGAGQTPGATIGNGRATAILFAREGARVLCVDRDGARAAETVAIIDSEGGQASALAADIVRAKEAASIIATAEERLGGVDVLVNNVGVGGGSEGGHDVAVAASNAKYGLRCNAVLPGLMDTPMAITGTAGTTGRSEAEIRELRSAVVPLKGGMGTAWDTAYAVLYLASEEARFVTGALLPVDGGMSARVG